MECSTTVIIDKPIQQVWDYVNTPDNMVLWLNDFVRYEHLTGDQYAPAVGDTSRHTYLQNGKEFSMVEEITEYDPPNDIKMMLRSDWFDMQIVNEFRSVSDTQTSLFAEAKTTRTNWIMKIVLLFGGKKQQTLHEEQILKLKQLIEAEPS